jgi:hypothetical protein
MEAPPWLERVEVRACLVGLGVFFLVFAVAVLSGDAGDRWAATLLVLAGVSTCATAIRGARSPRWLSLAAAVTSVVSIGLLVVAVFSVSALE